MCVLRKCPVCWRVVLFLLLATVLTRHVDKQLDSIYITDNPTAVYIIADAVGGACMSVVGRILDGR